jgi:hypothetical protein
MSVITSMFENTGMMKLDMASPKKVLFSYLGILICKDFCIANRFLSSVTGTRFLFIGGRVPVDLFVSLILLKIILFCWKCVCILNAFFFVIWRKSLVHVPVCCCVQNFVFRIRNFFPGSRNIGTLGITNLDKGWTGMQFRIPVKQSRSKCTYLMSLSVLFWLSQNLLIVHVILVPTYRIVQICFASFHLINVHA